MIELKTGIYLLENELPPEFCRDVIERFENSPDKEYGLIIGNDGKPRRHEAKQCMDVRVLPNKPEWKEPDAKFFESTKRILDLFLEKNPEIGRAQACDTGYLLQRYEPGDYFKPHIDSCLGPTSNRFLSVIWYLNDVEEGGETYFCAQDLLVRPRAGSAIVFAPFWTHLHEGRTPKSGTKYICTTFLANFGAPTVVGAQ